MYVSDYACIEFNAENAFENERQFQIIQQIENDYNFNYLQF